MNDYILRFSDRTKTETVQVPSMPPGINTVDTSLNLVGRGYPAYGEKIAENFLHLLENFSSPVPPENPIEGQLWYDTSNPRRKVLRIMDGTASATRWPSVSGIYQQGNNPKLSPSAGLKNGDIWVDTVNSQLKIFNNNEWTLVGPLVSSGSAKTGPETWEFTENIAPFQTRRVILNWVAGQVVSVISSGPQFIPSTYPPGMEGFSIIKPGVNLTNKIISSSESYLYSGTAENSNKLGNVPSTEYVLNNRDQNITSSFTFVSPDDSSGRGRYGILLKLFENSGSNQNSISSKYIQFYKLSNDAIIFNSEQDGSIRLEVAGTPTSQIRIEKNLVTVNTSTVINGSLSVGNNISSKTVNVLSTLTVNNNILVGGSLQVTGNTTSSGILYIGTAVGSGAGIIPNNTSTYDIGSSSKPFRSVYAENVYTSNYNYLPGELKLWAGSPTAVLPEGWMYCTGTNLSTSTYIDLFNVIGYYYGGSDDTFYIPDLSVTSTQGSVTVPTYYIIKT